jgi:hypothetical protein
MVGRVRLERTTIALKVLGDELMSIYIKKHNGKELFIEEMDMKAAIKLKDYLNYAIKG